MLSNEEKFKILLNLGIELSNIHDLDLLMQRILTEARRFTNADAGSIYLKQGNNLHFSYTQNDTLQNRLKPKEKLIYNRFSIPINQSSIAGFAAFDKEIVNIPDVYDLPNDMPCNFSKKFDKAAGYRTHSMITIPLQNKHNDLLGILQIINKQNVEKQCVPFSEDDEMSLRHFASIASVALERAQMTRLILMRMIRMAELRDPKETGAHVNRVGAYSVVLYEEWAKKKGISKEIVERNRDILRMGAMLHDAGKVGISDTILKKPSRFTEEEFEIMKTHTIYGAKLFGNRQSDFDEAAYQIALNHHERWDGKGYPGYVDIETGTPLLGYELPNGKARGKKGEEIPLFGRIVALADVYDALSSIRVYKKAWSEEDVLNELKKNAGTQFDPELVTLFLENISAFRSIQNRYKH